MGNWNFADVWEVIAAQQPDAPAQAHGDRRFTWADFDRRADGIGRALLDTGVAQQDKVAQYLYNGPEYLESTYACFKTGLVPVNTNYRYGGDELVYLWDNSDTVAVVFHGTFADQIEAIRPRLPRIHTWLWVDDGSGPCPAWALPYEAAARASGPRAFPPWGRSGDDLVLLYTGGTTGMPKGVMWRQDDLLMALSASGARRFPEDGGPDDVAAMGGEPGTGLVCLPAAPLMHGTGAFVALTMLNDGGSIVTLTGRRFDVEELLDTVQAESANVLAIVGDAFARPMVAALDAEPDRWDLSLLLMIISSGVMWSSATKEALIRHAPQVFLVDQFSSSEALSMGKSVAKSGRPVTTARFRLSDRTRVITDDGRFLVPGSSEVGRVAIKGRTPIGYYKDPVKSADTFPVIDGERWSVPGDYAQVEPDGTLRLLGRGSVCINTGGEKVYPEEVEEALKTDPSVGDAVVVGVPDERFGETVVAVVEPGPGAAVDAAALIDGVKAHLASYKAPRRVVTIDSIGRAANGKVDYKGLRAYALEQIEASS
jgi:acyl-CoA synthetase (AMP-forming)/AMP-acid ligase II